MLYKQAAPYLAALRKQRETLIALIIQSFDVVIALKNSS